MPEFQPSVRRLRAPLDECALLSMPCCFDALSARLIEEAGFDLTFMSGFAVSAARLALPDTGLIHCDRDAGSGAGHLPGGLDPGDR